MLVFYNTYLNLFIDKLKESFINGLFRVKSSMVENKFIAAEEFAKDQREISISEFFTKNRHLLGFDNPIRALMMTVKEAVDNSLDACTDMMVLPEIKVTLEQLSESRINVIIEDNGPGIVKKQIPRIFAKLLYGSKFHTLRQNRGQQGIGISASVLYSQLTTGKSTKITSKIDPKKPAHYYELTIDTKRNEPQIIKEEDVIWEKEHGIKIEIELEAKYQKGRQSVDEYIKQTAIANPHVHFTYITPEKERMEFPRATDKLPTPAQEIKPHPHGIELGTLIKMLQDTTSSTVSSFLQSDFSRIGPGTAKDIIESSGISTKKPKEVAQHEAEKLYNSLQSAKIIAPPTNCLSPIGQEILEKGLKKEINADFYVTITRPPAVYRGMPFQIEAAIAYGGDLEKDSAIRIIRFANRVPLLYQQGACSITDAVSSINWRPYGLSQSQDNLPVGPVIIIVSISSVWVPFTSEAKEAVAHYDEIIKEMKLALQECGRKLSIYINKHIKAAEQKGKINLFEKYIPEVAFSLSNLTGVKKDGIIADLEKMLKKNLPDIINEVENGGTKKE